MIKMKVNKISQAQLMHTLKSYEKATGKGIEIGIKEIAKSSARELASKVQPWGLTAAKGAKFEKSIGNQVDRAWFGANQGAWSGTTMEVAHRNARNSRGQVPYRQFKKGDDGKWLGVISATERNTYKRKQIEKAGRAKAGWIAAGNSLGVGGISSIPKWISRHLSDRFGKGWTKRASGISSIVTIENETPYLSKLQGNREIMTALRTGQNKGIKRLRIIISKIRNK